MNVTATHRIWILGAGRFGTIAAGRISKRVAAERIRVVDHRPERFADLPPGIETVDGDAVDYLVDRLGSGRAPDWIVPAVPVHVAWEFIRRRAGADRALTAMPPDAALLGRLPNAMTGDGGAVYASIADFLCPDNCPEPPERCTHTGLPRPMSLYREIPRIAGERWHTVVIRSRQLAPGVGGYPPEDLCGALARIASATGAVLLATACRCHGVMHGIDVH